MKPSQHADDVGARRCVIALLVLLAAANPAAAQSDAATPGFPLGSAERSILCGPRAVIGMPLDPLRVAGSDEGPLRRMFSPSESLIVSGGLADGLAAGQLFVVRRPGLNRLRPPEISGYRTQLMGIRTLGVIKLDTVDDALSSAKVLEMCESFVVGDYLVPFEPPQMPVAGARDTPPDYTNPGVVLFADPSRRTAGPGDFVVTDCGPDTVRPGQAVTFHRLALEQGGPVREIGTGMVVEVGESTSMIRIDKARDAIFAGDHVAPHARP